METKKESAFGSWMVVILSAVLMVVGAMLLFVPQIKLIYMCYFLCAATIIAGIYMIVRYFMTDAFRNMNEYGFSLGVLLVVLGICGTVRAEKLTESFLLLLGVGLVCSGVIKLQYAMDLKRMKDTVVSYVVLTISIIVIGIAVLVILQPFAEKGWLWRETARWYVMLIDGGLNLVLLVYMAIRLKLYKNAEKKAADRKEEATEIEAVDAVEEPEDEAAASESDDFFNIVETKDEE